MAGNETRIQERKRGEEHSLSSVVRASAYTEALRKTHTITRAHAYTRTLIHRNTHTQTERESPNENLGLSNHAGVTNENRRRVCLLGFASLSVSTAWLFTTVMFHTHYQVLFIL